MDQNFLTSLPNEVIIKILSTLPVRTIVSCKCVCKTLFKILETPDFVKSHLSRSVSVPEIIIYQSTMLDFFKTYQFEEDRLVPVTVFGRAFITPNTAIIILEGPANGLLFVRGFHFENHLYICNPITREYIHLPNCPEELLCDPPIIFTYGFGVSKETSQYKVVRVSYECVRDPVTHSLLSIPNSECRVYTLGTGSWRRVPHYLSLEYDYHSNGAFLNGSLHWIVSELKGSLLISCFDLETELFKTFSPPPYFKRHSYRVHAMTILGGCLCLCDNYSEKEIAVWVMKEYGVEESWTKEFVIHRSLNCFGESYRLVYPIKVIKVFRDDYILMVWADHQLIYYSPNVDISDLPKCERVRAQLHVSSFLSLKSFEMENVAKF